ncbi:hypothetical protein [Micromonospora echinofusca]|uniref:RNA-directed DNA polymerase n=1 Tax=Micromonospora echinofusca TaxID=47858 RepID=A0ABS3VV37_MICEH|nr:hypothetical protein [Micromonospora echinofusca]MBO4208388.1 hypothetical protein [Micromonospora echinofusca]
MRDGEVVTDADLVRRLPGTQSPGVDRLVRPVEAALTDLCQRRRSGGRPVRSPVGDLRDSTNYVP